MTAYYYKTFTTAKFMKRSNPLRSNIKGPSLQSLFQFGNATTV